MSAPHALSDIDALTSQIIETLHESKLEDYQKFEHIIGKAVDCRLIWREIDLNRSKFITQTIFQGGFSINPIAREGWTLEDFATNWKTSFPSTIRRIRNALSHAKEQRMTSVILPTAANMNRLQMWVPLMEVCAREVMVYRNII